MTYDPIPGEFFVVRTPGWVGRGIRVVTDSDVNHAGLYLGDGRTLEAQPSGAIFGRVSNYGEALWSGTNPTLLEVARTYGAKLADQAFTHHGDRYSFVDCACIGLANLFGVHVPPPVRQRLNDPHMNMCSQLVDRIHMEVGVHLFQDGRLPGDVSPGALRDLITSVP